MDAQAIKQQINLRDFIGKTLGKPKLRARNYDAYACPLHHESKGASLTVYDDHWKCWGKCSTGGDVFKWLELYEHLSFGEALASLGGEKSARRVTVTAPVVHTPKPTEPPQERWQWFARQVVDQAQQTLWSEKGHKALAYLKGRGLSTATIRWAKLGYIPPESENDYMYGRVVDKDWTLEGKPVRAHCGITIPHFASNHLWAVRVRRPPGLEGAKYMGIRGGSKALYWSDEVVPTLPILITEGEFDALIAWQSVGPGCPVEVCPVALASASNHRLDHRWLNKFLFAPRIFARLDADSAGMKAVEGLRQMVRTVEAVQVPAPHKDVNELFQAGGYDAMRQWVLEVCGE